MSNKDIDPNAILQSVSENLKVGETVEIIRDQYDKITGFRKVETSSTCWIVTANYGSPMHPNVCIIRNYREALKKKAVIGKFIVAIDRLYRLVGISCIGQWWIRTTTCKRNSIPAKVSSFLSKVFLYLAK